jgi:hypothetical protein
MRHTPARLALSVIMLGMSSICIPQARSPTARAFAAETQSSKAAARGTACWKDPRKHVERLGWNSDPRANVEIRYNERMKTCVLEIDLRIVRDGETVAVYRSLGDTRGREFATYDWHKPNAEDSAVTTAMLCEVFLSSGESIECSSEQAFDEVAASLMN